MRTSRFAFAAVAALCLLPSASPALAQTPAQVEKADAGSPHSLLAGVREVVAPGTPGELAVWGPHAVALVAGRVDKDLLAPVAAAAMLDRGRLVALAHTGMLDAGSLDTGDTAAFLESALRWCTPAGRDAAAPVRVGLLRCNLGPFITKLGWTPVALKPADLRADLAQRIDVLCIVGADITTTQQRAIDEFISDGGGLLAAQTAWAWHPRPSRPLADNPLNQLFARAGIAWTDGTTDRTGKVGFAVDPAPLTSLNASAAFNELTADKKHTLKPDLHDRQLARVATETARILPPADTLLRPRLAALLAQRDPAAVPSPDHPLRLDRPVERTLVAFESADLERLDTAATRAHPAAAAFPGAVPADAPRVERAVSIDLAIPEWHSTGLYAAPGEPITIRLPDAAAAEGLSIRIGCHKDKLWHLPKWDRMPEITRQWPLSGETTTVASPFGGLIYLVVHRSPRPKSETLRITISGAVEAPLFTLGSTSLEDWKTRLRGLPGPWAELATDKVILTVPSSEIRTLDDPESLLRYWDRLADAEDELGGISTAARVGRPERFVADVQISAGYMHSGYPIMTHLDATADMVSLEKLRAGTWGLLHELGHNHQRPEWTFGGTGEVTNNVFVLYTLQTVCERPWDEVHKSLKNRDQNIAKYLAAGARFEVWKSDPFLALQMYAQLVEGFGWDTYKRVLAEYRDLPDDQRPKTDDQKRDQWLVRFSRACGRNLGPFFQAWGVPTSDAARASLADLPDWMPPGFPPSSRPQPSTEPR